MRHWSRAIWAFVLLALLVMISWSPDSRAQWSPSCPKTGSTTYTCETNVGASAHCQGQLAGNQNPGGDFLCIGTNTDQEGGTYGCKSASFHGVCSNSVHPGAWQHAWNIVIDCSDTGGDSLTTWIDGTVQVPAVPLDIPGSLCVSNCSYNSPNYDGECRYDDTDLSGTESEGDAVSCRYQYTGVGAGGECTSGPGQQSDPGFEGGSECQNLNCDAEPSSGGGSGTSGGGGGGVPGQNSPGVPGGGDGDPTTADDPSGSGDGISQSGGPGVEGGDCNPYSNPDCAFSSSGSGSGDCTVQPTCAGDPVQCAILYQNWAAMCYDDGEFNNPNNCLQAFTCSGDVLLCEIIRQQRTQYCDAFVGSGGNLDVFGDADFSRDLKDEAEVFDVEGMLDFGGLGFSESCPSPAQFTAYGESFAISFQPFCDFAPVIKTFVILASLLSAMFIVTGTGKRA